MHSPLRDIKRLQAPQPPDRPMVLSSLLSSSIPLFKHLNCASKRRRRRLRFLLLFRRQGLHRGGRGR